MNVKTEKFEKLPDNREVSLYTLTNDNGIEVKITNYGVNIINITTPDKNGKSENIVLGFNRLIDYLSDDYLSDYPYFGVIIGRFGNRIAKGHLKIEGKTYQLAVNNGPNHLHGGLTGFDRRLWNANPYITENAAGIEFSYLSLHMEENYPGNLNVRCICTLTSANELVLEYVAKTDQTTVVNLTNHTYFNLTGGKENILNHELKLATNKMTEMEEQIPTGKIIDTADTPFDFTEFKTFAKDLAQLPTGYDDNFVLDNPARELKYAATLREKNSGRQVEVYTSQPGMQLYTGYWIPELMTEGEKKFGSYSGVALETQHFPDSVHHPDFPSVILNPGETFNEKTIFKFSVM